VLALLNYVLFLLETAEIEDELFEVPVLRGCDEARR
jgi:hypothetical protein